MVSAPWMLSSASTPVFCQKVKRKALRGHPTSGRLNLLLYFQFFCVLCPACFASKRQACLCVLSSFSHVQLSATLWTVARQAPLSMGFSRQKTGVGCHALLRGSSALGDQTHVSCISCISRWVLYLGSLQKCTSPTHWHEMHGVSV